MVGVKGYQLHTVLRSSNMLPKITSLYFNLCLDWSWYQVKVMDVLNNKWFNGSMNEIIHSYAHSNYTLLIT